MRRAGGAPSALVFVQDYDDYDDYSDFISFILGCLAVFRGIIETIKLVEKKKSKSVQSS